MSTSGAPISCTFPNGDTHEVELPPAAQLTVLDICQKLSTLTPYEADAIQLISMEGEGRELIDDEEAVSPGSQLLVTIRDIQAVRKTALRNALAAKDYAGCWALMVPCEAKSPYPLIAKEGDVVRLTAVNGPYYSFIGLCKRWDDSCRTDTPDYYLLHESEFSVTWTRSGPTLEGEDMESDWFMYADQREQEDEDMEEEDEEDMEEVDDPEPPAFCEACNGHYLPDRGHVFWFANPIEREGRRFNSACRACMERYDIDERAPFTN